MGSRLPSALALALVPLILVAAVAPAVASTAVAPAAPAGPSPSGSAPAGSTAAHAAASDPASVRSGPPRSAAVAAAAAAVAGEDVRLTETLALTPGRPGSVAVTLRFAVPDAVEELEAEIEPDARAVETDGFAPAGGATYEWDGRSDVATITYRLPANATAEAGRFAAAERAARAGPAAAAGASAAGADDGGYLFVDTGPWALVRLPRTGVSWRYRGEVVGLTRDARVAGEGAVGGEIAFLGAHTVRERTAHGQTFRLVVPAASSMAASPEAVLDSYASASDSLRVGDRDPTVFVVAAPAGVDWAVRGIQTGDADAWVRAAEPLDGPDTPWLHEYVHTRQSFEPTAGTRWVIEGSADYYAALLSLRQERIGFDAFADHLALGGREPYASAVLADPDTWARGANYRKGALVAGVLDRRIRLASDGSASFGTVLRRLNEAEEPVTGERFLAAVGAVSDGAVADAAARYTRTDATPEMWTEAEHEPAFGPLAARVEVVAPASVTVRGPYRNATLSPPAALAAGETVVVPVGLVNAGDDAAQYRLRLAVDGRTVATANGTLAAGENATVPLSWTAAEPGTYDLTVGDRSYPLTVREPATPAVASLAVERSRIAAGESALVVARVIAPGDVPAAGDLVVRVDGEPVATERVRVAPGDPTTLRVPVSFPGAGSYGVSVGDRSVTVTVATPTPSPTAEPTPTPGAGAAGDRTAVPTPGLGAATALAALLAVCAVAAGGSGSRRRR